MTVYKLDRFSRNKYEMAIHRKHLKDNGVKILSAMENIPETPEGILLESLLEGMNQYYSEECFYGHNISKQKEGEHISSFFTPATLPESICYFFSASTFAFIKDIHFLHLTS